MLSFPCRIILYIHMYSTYEYTFREVVISSRNFHFDSREEQFRLRRKVAKCRSTRIM